MKIDLSGKRVLITAGAAGIGWVAAERFQSVGARVAVCDIDQSALDNAASAGLLSVKADVSDPDDVDVIFDRVERELGGLDILVNNAGVSGPTKPVEDITPAEWRQTIDVNVNGQFYCVRRAVPLFKRQNEGVIVNISSTAGRLGMPLRSPYSTSKYAARGLTDVLAVELGEFNIRVNAVLPGIVNGPRGKRVITEQAASKGMTYEDYLPRLLHNVSMHAQVEQEEIAALVLFLSSDFSRHITGQSISVCGNLETYRAPLIVTETGQAVT